MGYLLSCILPLQLDGKSQIESQEAFDRVNATHLFCSIILGTVSTARLVPDVASSSLGAQEGQYI